jgi:hypothetical protein
LWFFDRRILGRFGTAAAPAGTGPAIKDALAALPVDFSFLVGQTSLFFAG